MSQREDKSLAELRKVGVDLKVKEKKDRVLELTTDKTEVEVLKELGRRDSQTFSE